MLRQLTELKNFTLGARDGEIGSVRDFYFDDETWTVRYLVVNTGPWLLGRQVLISPVAIDTPRWEEEVLPTGLTQEQIKNSPDIDLDQPVSRQHEIALNHYYGWPNYWYPSPLVGMAAPHTAAQPVPHEPVDMAEEPAAESHLRSVAEVTGYRVDATDGEIGHIADFFASEMDWIIRYALVDTGHWLPGRKVLIAPDWITNIEWLEREVQVQMTRKQFENSPEFDPKQGIDRQYETNLYRYYEYPVYWGV